MTYRDNVSFDQTPIQQSMTVDEADYAGVYQVGKLMLGVILEVHPSDREQGNSSSWQSKDRRGYRHEATVLRAG
jgi:hypothetical protein